MIVPRFVTINISGCWRSRMGVFVKVLAILTVLTANVVVVVCGALLAQIPNCQPPCHTGLTNYIRYKIINILFQKLAY